ncbi:MAG: hypothetical protein KUL83_00570 [Lentimicrobium sp.]|jgi:hypothetical protein|nr:hypothetical protein [Lentimicrobium sp.]MDD2528156.1 hypothetical protein [Lentimicrobiaceae bacterium]MDD4598797.1 hypothetical protein [Lentimicrobiaceae bacterium]MDY0026335.1 hypothetical protein [Lentimicrobium sp.]
MKKLISITGIAVFGALIFFSSCSKDKDEAEQKAPMIPPVSTFAMDFDQMGQPSDTTGSREATSFHNWGYAYLNVLAWHTAVNIAMFVPVAAFTESFNHEAIYDPQSNNWNWSYNVTANNTTYLARLSGKYVADSVEWEMRITQSGAYNDFLWFYGTSAADQSGGYWLLNENPALPQRILRIDWKRTSNEFGSISYRNIKPGDAQNGAYITYGATAENFNRYYIIHNQAAANTTHIEWHATDLNGRIKDPAHFNDNDWHCWDTHLRDISCN